METKVRIALPSELYDFATPSLSQDGRARRGDAESYITMGNSGS